MSDMALGTLNQGGGGASLQQQQMLQELISSLSGQNSPNKGQSATGQQQLPASGAGAAGQAAAPINSALQNMVLKRIGSSLAGNGQFDGPNVAGGPDESATADVASVADDSVATDAAAGGGLSGFLSGLFGGV